MGVALADVQGDDLTILGITVYEGDVVEQTKVLLDILQAFVEIKANNIVGTSWPPVCTRWMTRLTLSSSEKRPK